MIDGSHFFFLHISTNACMAFLTHKTLCEHLQDGSSSSSSDGSTNYVIEPLPGLETIVEELLREDGYNEIYA